MRMPRTVALSAMMRTRRAKAREVGTFGGELAGEMEIGFNCIFILRALRDWVGWV